MKATLITLIAMAGVASAMTEQEAQNIISSATIINDTYDFQDNQKNFTVIGVVDLDAYAQLRPTLSSSNRPRIMTFTDSQGNVLGARFGDTRDMYNCLFITDLNDSPRTNAGAWNNIQNIGKSGATGTDLYIGNAKSMAITLGYSGPNGDNQGTQLVFSYTNLEGEPTTVIRNDAGLRWAANTLETFDLAEASSVFSKVYMIEGIKYVGEDLAMLTKVATTPSVPEPTTGTLSLLALAGLCIRRRK